MNKTIPEKTEYLEYFLYILENNEVDSWALRKQFDIEAGLLRNKIKLLCDKPYNFINAKSEGSGFIYSVNYDGLLNYVYSFALKNTDLQKKINKKSELHFLFLTALVFYMYQIQKLHIMQPQIIENDGSINEILDSFVYGLIRASIEYDDGIPIDRSLHKDLSELILNDKDLNLLISTYLNNYGLTPLKDSFIKIISLCMWRIILLPSFKKNEKEYSETRFDEWFRQELLKSIKAYYTGK